MKNGGIDSTATAIPRKVEPQTTYRTSSPAHTAPGCEAADERLRIGDCSKCGSYRASSVASRRRCCSGRRTAHLARAIAGLGSSLERAEADPVDRHGSSRVPAGRVADDPASSPTPCSGTPAGRAASTRPDRGPRPARIARLLSGAAQRVLADRSIGPDHPVARDDERNGVVAERRPDGSHRLRPADLRRDPAVGPDLARAGSRGLLQDLALERRCGRGGRREPRPAGRLRAAARCAWPGPRARRPRPRRRHDRSGSRWCARTSASSIVCSTADTRARSRPRTAARAAIRSARSDPPGRPARGRPAQGRRRRKAQPGEGSFDGSVVGGHAVISSRSRRWAVSSAVRRSARPRWTCALTVPSGRSSAWATSG